MIITVPDWAMIGSYIFVKDIDLVRGDDPEHLYEEKIVSYGYDGFFHKAPNCPTYYSKFSDLGKTIFLAKSWEKQNERLHNS